MDRLAPAPPPDRRRLPPATLWTAAMLSLAAAAFGAAPAALAAPAAVVAPAALVVPAAGAPAVSLPPDFPADVPLPPGSLQGATGGAGQWSVLLLVRGSAAQAHAATVAFYRAHGFIADTDSILHDAAHQVTIVVENRDHSPNETFIAIGVANRQAAPSGSSGRVALAGRLTGHGRGSASITITGARLCWTFRNMHGVARPTKAAIRQAATGSVVVPLGRRYRASGCTAVTAGLGAAIGARPSGFTVTVATRAHPRGAVRARLRRA
jgi:CHRD domain-containing protein